VIEKEVFLKERMYLCLFCQSLDKNIFFYCSHFLSDRFLPDKDIDLIDEAGSRVRLRHAQVTNAKFFRLQTICFTALVLAECGSLVL